MSTWNQDDRERLPLGREMKRLADAFSQLVRDHMDLARAELRQDARRYAADIALAGAALPFALAALLLLDVALALGLAAWLGTAWAFALVGLLNLGLALLLGAIAMARLKRQARPLPETAAELENDRALLLQMKEALRNERAPLPPPGIRSYSVGSDGS